MVYNRETLLKWMIWGYHYFRKHPYNPYTTIMGKVRPLLFTNRASDFAKKDQSIQLLPKTEASSQWAEFPGRGGYDTLIFTQEKTNFQGPYGCFLKWRYPQIIHFNRVFHYEPSILGYHHLRKHPYGQSNLVMSLFDAAIIGRLVVSTYIIFHYSNYIVCKPDSSLVWFK